MTRRDRRRRARQLRRKRFLCLTTALVVFLTATVLLSGAAHSNEGGETADPQEPAVVNREQTAIAVMAIPQAAPDPEELHDGPDETGGEVQTEDPAEEGTVIQTLLARGYIRDEIPLSYENQIYLRAACEESGIPLPLALAVIQQETQFQNVTGDNGNSLGFMQIQPKWNQERMERLGVTDLMDPLSNFRVGCDLLGELLGKYELKEALTSYNSGHAGHNAYSDAVADYYEEWMEVLEWE